MAPPLPGFLCKLTDAVRAPPARGKRLEQFIFLLSQSSRPSAPSAQDLGSLGVCALHCHRCASSLGSPVTREPATDQNKRGGGSREGQRSLCGESDQVSWECLSAVQGGSRMGLEVGE